MKHPVLLMVEKIAMSAVSGISFLISLEGTLLPVTKVKEPSRSKVILGKPLTLTWSLPAAPGFFPFSSSSERAVCLASQSR